MSLIWFQKQGRKSETPVKQMHQETMPKREEILRQSMKKNHISEADIWTQNIETGKPI